MPTTGIMPTTIPRFIKSVEAKIKLSPPILNLQNLSRALYAKYKHLTKIKKNNKQITETPRKPNSSAITAKIKSVSVSGRKSKYAWEPSWYPLPFIPPEPIAIFDWVIFHPVP